MSVDEEAIVISAMVEETDDEKGEVYSADGKQCIGAVIETGLHAYTLDFALFYKDIRY